SARESTLGRQRTQLKIAEVDLVPFGLQQELPGRGDDIETFVDSHTVDFDSDPRARAETLDFRPFPERAGDIVFATRVDQFLEEWLMLRPPESPAGVSRRLASLLPACATVLAHNDRAGDGRRERIAVGRFAANDNQI